MRIFIRFVKKSCSWCIFLILYIWALLLGKGIGKRRKGFVWGSDPIINNKYWSEALKNKGYTSFTLMSNYYSINKKTDFDLYFKDFEKDFFIFNGIKKFFSPYLAFLHILNNALVFHISYNGGPLSVTAIWKYEIYLLKKAGIYVIVIPYGSDGYIYSKIIDLSLRHALISSYPSNAKKEKELQNKIDNVEKKADIIIRGFMIDGASRWDVLPVNYLVIDIDKWIPVKRYTENDGKNGIVKIIHTPNHRGFKGTEFLIEAVNVLKEEGLKIELILLEKIPNDKVFEVMQTADILAEQFIFIGYALSGIEGMATGLPVLSNLENENYTRLMRRYSYLNECPILSTCPENLRDNLRTLITHPKLRAELGRAGRKYVEKYHSYKASQYLFTSVYDKIIYGKNIDLINLYHPLISNYVKTNIIKHPLIENRLPVDFFEFLESKE